MCDLHCIGTIHRRQKSRIQIEQIFAHFPCYNTHYQSTLFTCIKSIKQSDLNTVWRPDEKSLVMKLCTVCNEDRWIVQTHLKGWKVLCVLANPAKTTFCGSNRWELLFLLHRITVVPLTHQIALTHLHRFAWRGRHYHFHQSLFTLHRGIYERSHALVALLLRHARTFIGHFQRMVKNRSRWMLGLLTKKLPENYFLALMFIIMCETEEATSDTKQERFGN